VRSVNWLGDAVMTTPALQRLRECFPAGHISLLGPRNLGDLWLHHPSLDAHLAFEPGESPWSVARRLRAEHFDTALVFPNSPRSALETWLGGIPQRIGYATPWRSWFLTQPMPPRVGRVITHKRSVSEIRALVANPAPHAPATNRQWLNSSAHQIHDYLHIAAALGATPVPLAPRLEITPAEMQQVERTWVPRIRELLANASTDGQPLWLGLNPSAAYGPAKCWPVEKFAAVVQEVSRRLKAAVWLIFGTPNDRELCERIAQLPGTRAANLAGKTSLRELMTLLKLCRLVLTNDSGPMHVAAALGTPVVVPFGSTSPELTGPGLPGSGENRLLRADAPCSPCFRRTCPIDFRCMTGISVDSIAGAIFQTLGNSGLS